MSREEAGLKLHEGAHPRSHHPLLFGKAVCGLVLPALSSVFSGAVVTGPVSGVAPALRFGVRADKRKSTIPLAESAFGDR